MAETANRRSAALATLALPPSQASLPSSSPTRLGPMNSDASVPVVPLPAPASVAPPPAAPPLSAAARVVQEYLLAHGYHAAEAALRAEHGRAPGPSAPPPDNSAALDDDLRGVMLALRRGVAADEARAYEDAYCELRDWVDGSLDLYKGELHSVLYPLLVHSFLEVVRRERPDAARAFLARAAAEFAEDAGVDNAPGRSEEIASLAGVASRQHLEENEAAVLFLNNRFELHLSSYAFNLVISFLSDDPRRAVLLRILNQHCRVRLDADADHAARTGVRAPPRDEITSDGFVSTEEKARCIENHEVLWGRLSPALFMISDDEAAALALAASGGKSKKAAAAAAAAIAAAAATAAAAAEAAKDTAADKGDAMDIDDDEEEDRPPHVRADGTLSESRIPLKRYRQGAEGLETEEDVKGRAPLGVVSALKADGDVANGGGEAAGENGKAEASSAAGIIAAANGGDEDALLLPSVLCYTYTNTRSDGLNCSGLSPDGSKVAAGFGDSSVRLWDAKASGTANGGAGGFGNQAIRLVGHSGPVYSVDWTKCARFVLSGSEDGTVRLWSAVTNADLVAYRGHNYPVWSVGFSPLDHYFASGSHDRTARVWATDRVYPLRILAGHLADVDVVRWHPNCNYVSTGSSDRTARLWDLRDGRCARVFGAQSGAVQSLAFSPDGRVLAVAGESRDIELWDVSMGKRLSTLRGHTGTVWSIDFSKDGSILASGGADCTVRLWNSEKARAGLDDNGGGAVGAENGASAVGTNAVLGKRGRNGKQEVLAAGAASSTALLSTLRTKQTPIHLVHFTRRNMLIGAGSFSP